MFYQLDTADISLWSNADTTLQRRNSRFNSTNVVVFASVSAEQLKTGSLKVQTYYEFLLGSQSTQDGIGTYILILHI